MARSRISFLFLNVGHFFTHLFVLVFSTVAALRLAAEWEMSYAALIPYATPGFVAFGVCAIPAGWLADRWSREGMMAIFFLGIGASSMLSAAATTPLQIGIGLTLIGMFAAIYHPVGLAMVVHGRTRTGMPVAVNGVCGNMGVACAALLSGFLIDVAGWRAAFLVPGAVSIAVGLVYVWFVRCHPADAAGHAVAPAPAGAAAPARDVVLRIFAIILFTTGIGGLVFQSTTFALPKIFDERLTDLAGSATLVGWYVFVVFAIAAFAQLVVGYLVDNYSARTVFALVALLQSVFLGTMAHLTGIPALLVSVAYMLAVFGQIPINDVLVGRIVRSEWRSRAYALRYVVTFTVMASTVPLIAWIHAGWGFALLFKLMAAAAAAIFVAVLLLPARSEVVGEPAPG